jgi:hypothetical protein
MSETEAFVAPDPAAAGPVFHQQQNGDAQASAFPNLHAPVPPALTYPSAGISAPLTPTAPPPAKPPAIDLDKLEREGTVKDPFDFVHNGRRYLMSDPVEIDWQDLLVALNNPVMFFRLVLPADDRNAFFSDKLPSWKMQKLTQAYLDHYGLPSAPNAGGLPL